MMEENNKPDYIGNTIVFILLGLLIYAGFVAYKTIDWNVLKNLEKQELILPTPIPSPIASPSATATDSAQ